jgi:regulator of sigma E protease
MRNLIWVALVLGAMIMYLQPGHWAMIAALMLMIVVHEFGHWFLARLFGFNAPVFSVGFGSKPRLYLGKLWGTEFQITPWLFGGYVKIDPTDGDFTSKAAWKRASVLVGGVAMNVLTVVVLAFAMFTTVGERHAVPTAVQVQQVDTTITIARDAGIQPGDQFVSVDGKPVSSAKELSQSIGAHKDGTPATVVVRRGAEDVTVTVTPNSDGRIGIALGERYEVQYKKYGITDGAARAVGFTADMGVQMFRGIGMMIGLVETPQGLPAGATDVHGLVAVVQMGEMAFNDGAYSFLMLVMLMSMNLAVFNILPIPLLDGGHLMFLGWEKLTGRPLNKDVQGRISQIFFFLLIALMLFGLFNDIFRPIQMP